MPEQAKRPAIEEAEPGSGRAPWEEKVRRPGLICVVLATITLAVFLPVGGHGFVNYDDADYLTENAHVQGGLTRASVAWAFTTGAASNWHPLTWLSHMLDWQLFGVQAGGHHLVSAGFHVANTLLLFGLLRLMTGTLWRSALVAALFALHPLHVESVAWASERKDVLSTFFFMLSLWAYARYAQAQGRQAQAWTANGRWRLYALSLVFVAFGLMSKPMLVTLPFVLLLLDYWPLKRSGEGGMPNADPGTADGGSTGARRWAWLVLEKMPFFALALASSIVTFIVQRNGGAVSTSLPLTGRLANALVSYVRYIGKMFWPQDLAVLYPHPIHWPAWQVLVSAGLLLVICAGVILGRRNRPYLAVGWFWFCGTLVPAIGLVQVGIQSMADRYTYVPLIGLFIMLVWGIDELIPSQSWRGRTLALGTACLLAACAGMTERQIQFWRNSEELFGHAVRVTRNNYLAYNNLGFYLSGQGRATEAMDNYRLALKINPAYEDALNNLGYALAGQKRPVEAIPLYEAALRIRPSHTEVHNNLGNALSDLGRIDEAIEHYLRVLHEKPDHADAHNNLGIALAMKGKLEEAIIHFHQAIRCKPGYASAHSNLGNALAAQHKLAQATHEYREALRLKPDDPQAHNNLGNALAEQGQVPEAIEHYREALRLNVDNPEAHYNLALALLRQSNRPEALGHLQEALRLRPDYPQAQAQLSSLAALSR